MLNLSLGLRFLLFLTGLAVFGLPSTVWAQGGPRAARLREIAANYLGGTADALSELLPGEDVDAALLDPLGGGMLDLEQSLGEAVFAVSGCRQHRLRPACAGLSRPSDHLSVQLEHRLRASG